MPLTLPFSSRLAWYASLLLWLTAPPAFARVVLNEVMYDPVGPDYHHEYVEVVNIGAETLDLAGWRLGDGEEMDLLEGERLSLDSGQYGLIVDGSLAGAVDNAFGRLPAAAVAIAIDDNAFGRRGWPNSRPGHVILVDAAGNTVDSLSYSPLNEPGRSYERVVLDGPSTSANWLPARFIGGTPGRRNSGSDPAASHQGLRLTARPNPFSEAVAFGCRVACTPALVNLWLYDVEGNLLRRLLDNAEAKQSGTVVWDGRTEARVAVPFGSYIAYVSASLDGRLAQERLVVVRSPLPAADDQGH